MAKQSGFLRQQREEKNALMHSTEVLVKQFMVDTLLITMNKSKEIGWGFDRLMHLLDEWEKTREEYREALDPLKSNEADVKQAHMDQPFPQSSTAECRLSRLRSVMPTSNLSPTIKGDNSMKVKLDPGAIMPTRAHETDAGLDIYSREDKVVPARGSAIFDTGVHVE